MKRHKQPVKAYQCKCGVALRGKYAIKRHICRPQHGMIKRQQEKQAWAR